MKKIIVAAVAAAIIAPAVSMAAGPVLYGRIHTSVDYNDNGGKSSQNESYDDWSLQTNSSRIGVKGSEDLGNGMKVGYLIEWGVDMDGDGGDLTERNRAITLSGDWGTALAGKWDTPFKSVGRKFDIIGNEKVGDVRAINGDLDLRTQNTLAYVTPNMGGFSATLAYVFDGAQDGLQNIGDADYSDDNSDNNAYSFNAIYNNGPILIGMGYINLNDDGQNSRTNTDTQEAWRVGGSYAFGDFKVMASYVDFDNLGFDKDEDPSVWTVGGSFKMGNNTLALQYADRDKSGAKDDVTGHKLKDGSDMWTIGLDHAMSKRTSVYANYASLSNDKDSKRAPWRGNGHGATADAAYDEDADSFSVGILHKF